MIEDYLEGRLGRQRTMYKVLVLEIDPDGNNFVEGNPPRTIRGKIISDDLDDMTHDDDADIFWPLLSEHKNLPIKCGEIVWGIYEDEEMRSGWWLCRARDDKAEMVGRDTRADVDRRGVKETPHYREVGETPLFRSRPDDNLLTGEQGQYVRLGRDRTEGRDSGGDGGVIDLVIGPDREDVDIKNDKVRLILAESTNNELEDLEDRPIAAMIADNILFVARKKFVIRADEVEIGGPNSLEPMVKGKSLMSKIQQFWNLFANHQHVEGILSPDVKAQIEAFKAQRPFSDNENINDALSDKSKVE